MNLEGKVALVTGAARRIGRAIALALAGEGMHVAVHYGSSEQKANETTAEIAKLGVNAYSMQANLSQPDEVTRMFQTVRDKFGRLDVLVNNAASFQRKNLLDTTLEDWDAVMNTNLRAPYQCSMLAAHMMQEGDGGSIINIVDLMGIRPRRSYPIHSISKAGLAMLTKTMALALGPSIRVNAIAPGAILPPAELDPERWQQLGEQLPLQRTGGPQNIQSAVLYLVKDDFVNGHVLAIDGGEILMGPFGF